MLAESSSNWIPFFLKLIPSPSHIIDRLMKASTTTIWLISGFRFVPIRTPTRASRKRWKGWQQKMEESCASLKRGGCSFYFMKPAKLWQFNLVFTSKAYTGWPSFLLRVISLGRQLDRTSSLFGSASSGWVLVFLLFAYHQAKSGMGLSAALWLLILIPGLHLLVGLLLLLSSSGDQPLSLFVRAN